MSYRRNYRALGAVVFEAVSLASNRSLEHLDDAEHVIEYAEDHIMNPDISFIGYDASGYQVWEWSIDDVLNGTFSLDTDHP